MKKIDPNVMKNLEQLDPLSKLSDWFFPAWINDLTRLQTAALFRPDVFPLPVLADDYVFKLMRRLQKSFVAEFLISLAAASFD